jgi:hypothetical protein
MGTGMCEKYERHFELLWEVSRNRSEARKEGTKLFDAGEKTESCFCLGPESSRYRQPAARRVLLMLIVLSLGDAACITLQ